VQAKGPRAMFSLRRSAIAACVCAWIFATPTLCEIRVVITDVDADIRELDVGDVDDMESDMPQGVIDQLKQMKAPLKIPTMDETLNPQDWALITKTGLQLSFASVKQEIAEAGMHDIAPRWKAMLELDGLFVQITPMDMGRLIFSTNGPGLVLRVRDFVLAQPETDWWEFDKQLYFPEGRTRPLVDSDQRKLRAVELGLKDASTLPPKKRRRRKTR